MSLIKLLNSSNKFFILFLIIFSNLQINAEDKPVDIWANDQGLKDKNQKIINKKDDQEESKINFLKESNTINEIEITNPDTTLKNEIKLSGLYDPERNDLSLTMWQDTDGTEIKKVFSRHTYILVCK